MAYSVLLRISWILDGSDSATDVNSRKKISFLESTGSAGQWSVDGLLNFIPFLLNEDENVPNANESNS